MQLNSITKKDYFIIKYIPENIYKTQLIRLGIYEGKKIKCLMKLPGGVIILDINGNEIALGSILTKTILVEKYEK